MRVTCGRGVKGQARRPGSSGVGWIGAASAREVNRAAEPADRVNTVARISHVRVVLFRLGELKSGSSPLGPARRSGGWPQLKSQGREIRILGSRFVAGRWDGRTSLREAKRA
ncbi:hypothetical protein GCM10027360_95210 [Amycolatopsis echigonensis]